jgi:hypothetical protein
MSEQTATEAGSITPESIADPTNVTTTQVEPTVPPTRVSGQSDPKMFSQEDLDRAREQEKSKVYKRLETMQEQVARLESEAKMRQATEDEARLAEEAKAEAARQENLSAKDLIAEKEAQWAKEQAELRQEIEAERALRERESQFAELTDFRSRVVTDYQDRVAPELLDLISGETPEEIQQSAEDMAQRTEAILAQSQEAMQNARQQMPTARVTAPVSGDNAGANRQYSPDEIRGMSMADYAKHRASLLGKGADGPKNRGLFG